MTRCTRKQSDAIIHHVFNAFKIFAMCEGWLVGFGTAVTQRWYHTHNERQQCESHCTARLGSRWGQKWTIVGTPWRMFDTIYGHSSSVWDSFGYTSGHTDPTRPPKNSNHTCKTVGGIWRGVTVRRATPWFGVPESSVPQVKYLTCVGLRKSKIRLAYIYASRNSDLRIFTQVKILTCVYLRKSKLWLA